MRVRINSSARIVRRDIMITMGRARRPKRGITQKTEKENNVKRERSVRRELLRAILAQKGNINLVVIRTVKCVLQDGMRIQKEL